jgi:hypothetical protein
MVMSGVGLLLVLVPLAGIMAAVFLVAVLVLRKR